MILSYYTPVKVKVANPIIVCCHYGTILVLGLWIILYNIGLCKGYQALEIPKGTVTTKIKGVAYSGNHPSNRTNTLNFTIDEIRESNDLVRVQSEANTLFIATSMLVTEQ